MSKEDRKKLNFILKRFSAWRKEFSSLHLDFVVSESVTTTYEMVSGKISEMQEVINSNEELINRHHNHDSIKNMHQDIAKALKLLLFTKDLPKNERKNESSND